MQVSVAEDYTKHWDEKFRTRSWGRYPPEDLVRFMGRNFRNARKSDIKVLELGCGPGANLWFLHREGFAVAGIDISPSAIDIATQRLAIENRDCPSPAPDLKLGNFGQLPWEDASFDVAFDIFSVSSNTCAVIERTLKEAARVLKPGGLFYCKIWGTHTTGFGTGKEIEPLTYDGVTGGPCRDMGVTHFFTREEIDRIFTPLFTPLYIDVVQRSDIAANQHIEEFQCQFKKAS